MTSNTHELFNNYTTHQKCSEVIVIIILQFRRVMESEERHGDGGGNVMARVGVCRHGGGEGSRNVHLST